MKYVITIENKYAYEKILQVNVKKKVVTEAMGTAV